jgi:hypothetical protein
MEILSWRARGRTGLLAGPSSCFMASASTRLERGCDSLTVVMPCVMIFSLGTSSEIPGKTSPAQDEHGLRVSISAFR